MNIICYSTLIISMVFSAVQSDNYGKGCLYGWYLSDDETTCYVNCATSQLYFSNVYCTFLALKSANVSYDSSTNILSMPSGDVIGDLKTSLIPSCYPVTLKNKNFEVTADGFIRIAPHLMEIPLKNVIKTTSRNVTLCYPSSPQLLQCEVLSASPGSYKIVNETILWVSDKNITVFLGDFYVNDEAMAFFCPQSSPSVSFTNVPRCNAMIFQHYDLKMNEDGSVTVLPANITIKNPVYAINYSQHAIVCLPLNFNFLNCPLKKEVAQYFYYSYPNLTLLNLFYRGLVAPLDYYISLDFQLTTCVTRRALLSGPAILYQLYNVFYILSGLVLLLTVTWRYKMFTQNFPSRCLLCHIVSLIIMDFSYGATLFHGGDAEMISCYVVFFVSYYFNMAAFFWLNVVAYDSWRSFSRIKTVKTLCVECDGCWSVSCANFPDNSAVKFALYNVFCWSLAAVLTAVILYLDFSVSPYDFRYEIRPYVLPSCFFVTFNSFLVFYYLPMTVSTIVNLVFLGLTIRIIHRASLGTELVNCRRRKQVFIISMKLFILMGFCWSVDCVCYGLGIFNKSVFQNWFLSVGVTSLQGVVVSFIYGARNEVFINICACRNRLKCR